MANPDNRLHAHYASDTMSLILLGESKQPGVRITAEIPAPAQFSMIRKTRKGGHLFPRLFLGLISGLQSRSLAVSVLSKPKRSPSILVFKDLRGSERFLESKNYLFNFLDFDIL